MLFNSYIFIILFLIPSLLVYSLVPKKYKLKFIIFISLLFYLQWSLEHLFILIGSICINYLFAILLSRNNIGARKTFLFLNVSFNISLLAYYKYSGFLNLSDGNIVLPLAISFFTFQQIAYIVDIYRKKILLESFEKYLFFVMFFPQLIAGPIVHYSNIISQINEKKHLIFNNTYFKAGIVLFSIGLFKKVVIADSLSADTIANSFDAWIELFSYSFMIYFDFSAYVDMAIGLALMFGLKLPMNFFSPYKAVNLIDFWRRWHITLSTFLKDHIYIPFGGNRFGIKIQILSIMITMIIGGIWHGAGWNFLIWGAAHGIAISFLHLYKYLFNQDKMFIPCVSVFFTFIFVSLTWVLFRESSFLDALNFYKLLFSFDFNNMQFDNVKIILLAICFFIIWGLPNSMQIIKFDKEKIEIKSWYVYLSAIAFFVSLKFMALVPSLKFVYFNF